MGVFCPLDMNRLVLAALFVASVHAACDTNALNDCRTAQNTAVLAATGSAKCAPLKLYYDCFTKADCCPTTGTSNFAYNQTTTNPTFYSTSSSNETVTTDSASATTTTLVTSSYAGTYANSLCTSQNADGCKPATYWVAKGGNLAANACGTQPTCGTQTNAYTTATATLSATVATLTAAYTGNTKQAYECAFANSLSNSLAYNYCTRNVGSGSSTTVSSGFALHDTSSSNETVAATASYSGYDISGNTDGTATLTMTAGMNLPTSSAVAARRAGKRVTVTIVFGKTVATVSVMTTRKNAITSAIIRAALNALAVAGVVIPPVGGFTALSGSVVLNSAGSIAPFLTMSMAMVLGALFY